MYNRIVVIGLGNILLKDEGVGVEAVNELKKRPHPPNVEFIDGGTAGLDLIMPMKDIQKLIVVDAIRYSGSPGKIYRFNARELLSEPGRFSLSLHQMDVVDTLLLANKIGGLPRETIVIGIEPKEVEWGISLSGEIRERMPNLIEVIEKEVDAAIPHTIGG